MAKTLQTQAEEIAAGSGIDAASVTVVKKGGVSIAHVLLTNGKEISTNLVGNWQEILAKQIKKFNGKKDKPSQL